MKDALVNRALVRIELSPYLPQKHPLRWCEVFVLLDVLVGPFPLALVIEQVEDAGPLQAINELGLLPLAVISLCHVAQLVLLEGGNEDSLVIPQLQVRQEIGHALSLHVLQDVNLASKALLCPLVAVMPELASLVLLALLVEEAAAKVVEETRPIVLKESVVVLATVANDALQAVKSLFFGLQFFLLALDEVIRAI